MITLTCDHCKGDTLSLVIHGAELWCWTCHHGDRDTQRAHGVIGDDIPGGFVQEHFGHYPEVFYSKKAMAKRADQLGLRPMVRHVDGDQHVTRWI